MEYRFDEKKHLHQLLVDGIWKNLTGCTTVLGVVAKPALIQWSANMAINYIRDNKSRLIKEEQSWEEILLAASKAHAKRKSSAGDKGKQVHFEIENHIKESMSGKTPEVYPTNIENFVKWVKDNKVKFLESEKNIYSEKLWIGGIVDFVCEIDGKIWIGDIKTSGSGIYPEHFWQCAGYHLMLQDMKLYPDIAGYLILNLKESGEFLEKRSVSNSDNIKAFLACLDIYRIQEKLNSQVI